MIPAGFVCRSTSCFLCVFLASLDCMRWAYFSSGLHLMIACIWGTMGAHNILDNQPALKGSLLNSFSRDEVGSPRSQYHRHSARRQ